MTEREYAQKRHRTFMAQLSERRRQHEQEISRLKVRIAECEWLEHMAELAQRAYERFTDAFDAEVEGKDEADASYEHGLLYAEGSGYAAGD